MIIHQSVNLQHQINSSFKHQSITTLLALNTQKFTLRFLKNEENLYKRIKNFNSQRNDLEKQLINNSTNYIVGKSDNISKHYTDYNTNNFTDTSNSKDSCTFNNDRNKYIDDPCNEQITDSFHDQSVTNKQKQLTRLNLSQLTSSVSTEEDELERFIEESDDSDDDYINTVKRHSKIKFLESEKKKFIIKQMIQNTQNQSSNVTNYNSNSNYLQQPSSQNIWNQQKLSVNPDNICLADFIPLSDSSSSVLSNELKLVEEIMSPQEHHIREKTQFLHRLQETISLIVNNCRVSEFGSILNGFWTPNSDIDICLQMPLCNTRSMQINLLRRIASELHKVATHYIEPRFGAKVPIIHWTSKKKFSTISSDDETYNQIFSKITHKKNFALNDSIKYVSCDISVNNVLAVVNSKLIGAYSDIDDRLRTVGMAIKCWAKCRGINDRSKGTLSSFSLILMLIHYMQNLSIPILPSLQDIAICKNYSPVYINGVDCRYCNDKEEIKRELDFIRESKFGGTLGDCTNNRVKPNLMNVGEILKGFFKYYGYDYKYGVISIRDCSSFSYDSNISSFFTNNYSSKNYNNLGLTTSALADSKNTYLFVDNPFEVGKDVANILASQYNRIQYEFRRGYSLLQKNASFETICRPNKTHG